MSASGSEATSTADWLAVVVVVVLIAWFVAWQRLRADYRRPGRLITFCWVTLVASAVWLVTVLLLRKPAYAVASGITAALAIASMLKAIANRRLAGRLTEVTPAIPAPTSTTAAAPSDPHSSAVQFDERTLWSIQIPGVHALPSVAGTLLYEFVRSLWSTRGNARAALAATLPKPVDGVDRRGIRGAGTLFLWVFENEPERDLIDTAARTGPVMFLRGGGILAEGHLLDTLRGKEDEAIETSADEVAARLAEIDAHNAAGPVGAPACWPVQSMLCSDATWTIALDGLLQRAQRVVMDLSLFGPGRRGCEHELAALVDRVPTSAIILITGRRTDTVLLREVLTHAWANMAADSPNRRPQPAPFLLLKARYLRSHDVASESDRRKKLVTPREQEIRAFASLIGVPEAPDAP